MKTLDCIIIGYNEVDYNDYASSVKPMMSSSAAYADCKTNSIFVDGKRITYMQAFNQGIEKVLGKQVNYSAFGTPGLATCYLTHFLRKKGFSVEDVNLFQIDKIRLQDLLSENPKFVAITTTFYVDPYPINEIISYIRTVNPSTKIIVGGPYIFKLVQTLNIPLLDRIFKSLGADLYVIESQGELTLSKILFAAQNTSNPDFSNVPNLAYIDHLGTIKFTVREPENNSLEDNIIDWNQFRDHLAGRSSLVRTARSCAYKCEFCCYPLMAGDLTTTNVAIVEKELRQLHDLGVRYLHFVDDTFNIPKQRFKDICQMMINNNFEFKWTSFFRCGNADEEQIELAAKSGCIGVELGIESGDNTVLKNMNKVATQEKYLLRISQLHKVGIMTYCMLFIGYPGETEQTVMNTFQFVEAAKPTFYISGVYYHDVAAPVHKKAKEYGIVGSGYSWRHKTMAWQEAAEWVNYYYRNIQSSIIMPLQGFSFETITYLLGQGFSLNSVKNFAKIAQRMMVKGLDDAPEDLTIEKNEIVDLFRQEFTPGTMKIRGQHNEDTNSSKN